MEVELVPPMGRSPTSSWVNEMGERFSSPIARRRRQLRGKLVAGLLIVIVSVLLATYCLRVVATTAWSGSNLQRRKLQIIVWGVLGTPVTGLGCALVLARSSASRSAANLLMTFTALLIWVTIFSSCVVVGIRPFNSSDTSSFLIWYWFTSMLYSAACPCILGSIYLRIQVLERCMATNLSSRALSVFLFVACLSYLFHLIAFMYSVSTQGQEIDKEWRIAHDIIQPIDDVVFTLIAIRAFLVAYLRLLKLQPSLRGTAWEDQTKVASRSALMQCLAVVLRCAIVCLLKAQRAVQYAGLTSDYNGDVWSRFIRDVCLIIEIVLFSGYKIDERGASVMKNMSKDGNRHSFMKTPVVVDPAWQHKVADLALRAFSVDALLLFYSGLGKEYMLHFKPNIHRTCDVVRCAIVPLSSGEMCAYSDLMMDGKRLQPHRFVTHAWSNLFRDLVAAIVADALDEAEYGIITHYLENDMPTLEWMLKAANTLNRTYWVCAFCVNQHIGICDTNLNVDPVLGRAYPACDCLARKMSNSTSPALADGRSIPCEMNKFRDMMKFLYAASSGSIEHVVAVDSRFDLCGRAWCVAEVATGYELGLKQHLKVFARKGLQSQEPRLRNLRIQDMEASRAEDVKEILSSIEDHDLFNHHFRALLFDSNSGLLVSWWRLDTVRQMELVGRMARWKIETRTVAKDRRTVSFFYA